MHHTKVDEYNNKLKIKYNCQFRPMYDFKLTVDMFIYM